MVILLLLKSISHTCIILDHNNNQKTLKIKLCTFPCLPFYFFFFFIIFFYINFFSTEHYSFQFSQSVLFCSHRATEPTSDCVTFVVMELPLFFQITVIFRNFNHVIRFLPIKRCELKKDQSSYLASPFYFCRIFMKNCLGHARVLSYITLFIFSK